MSLTEGSVDPECLTDANEVAQKEAAALKTSHEMGLEPHGESLAWERGWRWHPPHDH